MNTLRPALAVLALLIATQGCSSDDDVAQVGASQGGNAGTAGFGGVGGTGGGGSGGGGAGGGGTGGCGTSAPKAKDPCTAGVECTYGDVVAICSADGWFVGQRATTAALDPGALCNPVGKWDLVYASGTKTGMFCTAPDEPDLEVRVSASGALVASFFDGTVSIAADGCKVDASVSDSFKNPSESWSSTTTIQLMLSANAGTGTYTKSNGGFCNGKETGTLSATRL